MASDSRKNIVIFASGSGTNAENIIRYFQDHPAGRVALLVSNNPDAGALGRAAKLGIPCATVSRADLYETGKAEKLLKEHRADLIVLAGFLWLIPPSMIRAYPDRILNIHPALLPAFGGKGMYGQHVHKAVLAGGAGESGISVHYVSSEYDRGKVIFQAKCAIGPGETPETLANKIHQLEYEHYPKVIEKLLTG